MAAITSASLTHVPFSISKLQLPSKHRGLPITLASSSSSAMPSHESSSIESGSVLSTPKVPFVESSKTPEDGYNYVMANPNGNPLVKFVQHTESTIERAIFDFRFLALLAVGGSLAGSLLCFLNVMTFSSIP